MVVGWYFGIQSELPYDIGLSHDDIIKVHTNNRYFRFKRLLEVSTEVLPRAICASGESEHSVRIFNQILTSFSFEQLFCVFSNENTEIESAIKR